jgi:polar amino acid transport system substrate-binding protein
LLAFVLGYTEMFTIAKQITAKETSLVALFIVGVFYYIFNFIVAWFMGILEKKLSYFN